MKLCKTSSTKKAQVVPRFESNLLALKLLFGGDSPPLRLVRRKRIKSTNYGFGDASGGGFGSSWDTEQGMAYCFGTSGENMDLESFNLREFRNLVDTLEKMHVTDVTSILRYLKGTEQTKGLILKPMGDFQVDCYVDADLS